MRSWTLGALAALLIAPAAAAQGLPPNPVVRAIVEQRVASGRHPGIVVGLLDESGRRIVAAGRAGPDPALPLDGNTVFEIGSVTKVFTALLLAEMAARGEVRLEDPVGRLLPADVSVPSKNGREITLAALATHTSGLPRMPANFAPTDHSNPYADYTVAQMYEFLARHQLMRDVGAQYEYSNLGMGLLGHALALRAGRLYESLLTERILEPLGMRDTPIGLTARHRARLASGHDATGNPAANWDIPTLAGAGALRSTANDMLTFLEANLSPPAGPLGQAMREARETRTESGVEGMTIGLAWHILERPNARIVWHNGGTGGYHSFVGFDSDRRVGVVVLANSPASIDDIGIHLLDTTFALETPKPLERRTEMTVAPAILDDYLGEYQLAPGFTITVTREGGQLFVQATDQPRFPAFAESATAFFLKVTDAQITFERDEAGQVTRLVLHQAGQHVPGRKIR